MTNTSNAITPAPFPGTSFKQLGNCTQLEPSGLALFNNQLYMASDDGKIAAYNFISKEWKVIVQANSSTFGAAPDFESMTVVKGMLMVGLEGSSSQKPQIAIIDVSTSSPKIKGSLELNPPIKLSDGGMEAMTFVPDSACPFGTEGYYDGYFFTAFQSSTNLIYVYNLPAPDGTIKQGGAQLLPTALKIDCGQRISDMCFANNLLYVLFDNGNDESDLLAVYSIDTKAPNVADCLRLHLPYYSLPKQPVGKSKANTSNYEGITLNGQTIYLARDSKDQTYTPNAVYEYPNTTIDPYKTA